MVIRIRILSIAVLFLLLISLAQAQSPHEKEEVPDSVQTIDKIVAVVNGEVITQMDLLRALAAIEAELRTTYADPEELAEKLTSIKKNIIKQMIEEKLILSEAKKFDLQADHEKIDARLEQLRATFPSAKEFDQALESQDLTLKDLQDRFRDQEIMKKTVDYFVRSQIKVDPKELEEHYELHKSELMRPEEVLLKSILIAADNEQEEYAALQKAKTVLERLRRGDNFADLVSEYSQGVTVQGGGNSGWFKKGQLMEEIDEAIFNLEPGEFTEVIRTPQGYRIFLLEEKRPKQLTPFSEAQDIINNILYNQKFAEVFSGWIEKLKQDADILIKEQD